MAFNTLIEANEQYARLQAEYDSFVEYVNVRITVLEKENEELKSDTSTPSTGRIDTVFDSVEALRCRVIVLESKANGMRKAGLPDNIAPLQRNIDYLAQKVSDLADMVIVLNRRVGNLEEQE